jgi:hypothetical protein
VAEQKSSVEDDRRRVVLLTRREIGNVGWWLDTAGMTAERTAGQR